jgi:hypothetical protein
VTVYVVIWVVLMMFWLFGGGYWAYNGPNPNPASFGLNTLIPFLCVLILGLILFGALPAGPVVMR